MSDIKNIVDQNSERYLNELFALLRIPSVSADPKYTTDVLRMADAVKDSLVAAGAEKVEICPTPGYPIVYGEKIIDANLPTVLVYGHYDVQPPDPLCSLVPPDGCKVFFLHCDPSMPLPRRLLFQRGLSRVPP